jgi:hypothetical protein
MTPARGVSHIALISRASSASIPVGNMGNVSTTIAGKLAKMTSGVAGG